MARCRYSDRSYLSGHFPDHTKHLLDASQANFHSAGMLNDRKFWEEKFVDSYVLESKRSRYKKFLRDPKKRPKILDRLNHNADLDFSKAVELTGEQTFSEQLVRKLSTFKLTEQCRLISDDSELDGKSLPWKEAAELTADAYSGTIMICPPRPIIVYRTESPSKILYLFV